jgi:hypothetical protein
VLENYSDELSLCNPKIKAPKINLLELSHNSNIPIDSQSPLMATFHFEILDNGKNLLVIEYIGQF